jgi:beta-glucuronidase
MRLCTVAVVRQASGSAGCAVFVLPSAEFRNPEAFQVFSRSPALGSAPPLPVPALVITFLLLLALPTAALAQGGRQAPSSGRQPPAPPPPELSVERPGGKPPIYEGQTTRQLLGGTWYFRQDDLLTQGDTERWYEQEDLTGWTVTGVPHNWNGQDTTLNKSSVGWYRKEFTLPRRPKNTFWKVRFEGSNYRTWIWLNGKPIGAYTGYFPFEVDLEGLERGRNTLVVKVSSQRSNRDLTHWRPAAYNGFGTGGWWNFGGLLREVYVREIDTIDVEDVHVLPRVRRVGGPAKVELRVELRNMTDKDRMVSLAFRVGGEDFRFDPEEVLAGTRRELSNTFTIERPKLWQPGKPTLYPMTVYADEDRGRRSTKRRAAYKLRFGIRKLETRGDRILLNGKRLNLRGASIHEDDAEEGGALSQGTRRRLVARLRDLGATITRSHYPLHPQFLELFDKYGILYWVDAPVYQLPNRFFEESGVRKAAERAVILTVRNNLNHPSVMTWALVNEPAENGNELGFFGPGFARWVAEASAAARELDDTRLIAIDRHSRLGEPVTSSVYKHLDVLGVNEYFGWYRTVTEADPTAAASTLDQLGPYLDSINQANPSLPIVITEYGAEAAVSGAAEQKGTFEFQRKFAADHLRVHTSKPYVNGSIWWALRDFRVHPQWTGGAPEGYTTTPWHNKSLIEETGARKGVYYDMKKRWRRTNPLLPAGRRQARGGLVAR